MAKKSEREKAKTVVSQLAGIAEDVAAAIEQEVAKVKDVVTGRIIKLLTVQEILDESHVQKM